MKSLLETQTLVLEHCKPSSPIVIPLADALGFASADNILASHPVPPFHRAMMDGYALQSKDTAHVPVFLRRLAFTPAGSNKTQELEPHTAIPIATGAPVPMGADAVQMRERCREAGDTVEILESIQAGKHIAPAGSECPEGTCVLRTGDGLNPAALAVLATFGHGLVRVFPKPTVALINTGSELVNVSEPISGGKIRNSNQFSIQGLLNASGFSVDILGIVPDATTAIRSALQHASDFSVIVLTGGVSEGDLDLVSPSAQAAGFHILVDRVAIKPGKPMVFGVGPTGTLLFGLSGNPVSSMLQAAWILLPALRKMSGLGRFQNRVIRLPLAASVHQKPGRLGLRPARIIVRDGETCCDPLSEKGSADIFSWMRADCCLTIPAHVENLDAGNLTDVLLLDQWGRVP